LGADNISQLRVAEKTGCGESPVLRNLTIIFTEDAPLEPGGFEITPQEASFSNMHLDWKPIALTYRPRKLMVLANAGIWEENQVQGLIVFEKPMYNFYRFHPLYKQ
jgi:hypothetical protein